MWIEYEWVKTIEKKKSETDLNFTISTSWIGFGIVFVKGDFSWHLNLHLLVFHFSILKYFKGDIV